MKGEKYIAELFDNCNPSKAQYVYIVTNNDFRHPFICDVKKFARDKAYQETVLSRSEKNAYISLNTYKKPKKGKTEKISKEYLFDIINLAIDIRYDKGDLRNTPEEEVTREVLSLLQTGGLLPTYIEQGHVLRLIWHLSESVPAKQCEKAASLIVKKLAECLNNANFSFHAVPKYSTDFVLISETISTCDWRGYAMQWSERRDEICVTKIGESMPFSELAEKVLGDLEAYREIIKKKHKSDGEKKEKWDLKQLAKDRMAALEKRQKEANRSHVFKYRNALTFLYFVEAKQLYCKTKDPNAAAYIATREFNNKFNVPFSKEELEITLKSVRENNFTYTTKKFLEVLDIPYEDAQKYGLDLAKARKKPKSNRQKEKEKLQKQIKKYICQGKTVKEIAKRLNKGNKDIYYHITQMKKNGDLLPEKVINDAKERLRTQREKSRTLSEKEIYRLDKKIAKEKGFHLSKEKIDEWVEMACLLIEKNKSSAKKKQKKRGWSFGLRKDQEAFLRLKADGVFWMAGLIKQEKLRKYGGILLC